MCGFITYLDNEKVEIQEKLNVANENMRHRGPDSIECFTNNNIYMGFNRLSIIDLENGTQPMTDEAGECTIVFNGEIYNYQELKKELEGYGYVFKTNSDTEVALISYKHYGEDFAQFLRGMFAIVIWDNRTNTLVGARDPFGIKPFFYAETENGLYCSSEVRGIISSLEDKEEHINIRALHNYFTFQFVPEPDTIVSNVNILKPGHTIKKALNSPVEIKEYYKIKLNPQPHKTEDIAKQILDVMRDSVRAHMIADVPVGTFLSGGIDSTITTVLAHEINPELKTFSVGFDGQGYSEIDVAKKTAEVLGVENISKVITVEEFMSELPKIIDLMDVPVADPSAIPLYFLSKEARKQLKVVLSGEGSDEFFGGYNIYCESDDLKVFERIPAPINATLNFLARMLPDGVKGKSFILRGTTKLEDRYIGNAKIFLENEKKKLIKNYNKDFDFRNVTKPIYAEMANENFAGVEKMQFVDMHTWLRGDILAKADKMSMANSLEVRVPFLDKRVLELASTLNKDDKIRGHVTKYALREAFKGVIPDHVTDRKKLGFPVPIKYWLRNEMYDWAKDIIKRSEIEKFINKDYAMGLLEKHKQGKKDNSRRIWTIIIFALWYENYTNKTLKR